MQVNGQNQSVQSLTSILLGEQDEDKDVTQSLLLTQQNTSDKNNMITDSDHINISPMVTVIDNRPSQTRSKHSLRRKMAILLLFVLFLIIGLMLLIVFYAKCARRSNRLEEALEMYKKMISNTETKNSKSVERKQNKWKQHGITVAGGYGQGDQLDQLSGPYGIFIDHDKTMYIADYWNHRIVQLKYGEDEGQVIAGGNGQGNRTDQLNWPTDIVVDKQKNSLVISDWRNRRVVRWSRQNNTNQHILMSDIDCYGLAMDKNGFIYVSDNEKDEVRRWNEGETNGRIVAGGNGRGNDLNQLNSPSFIFVDEDDSLYVSDSGNHRVMKWRKDAREGIVVAGGNGKGESLTQLSNPQGVIVDHLSQIYVADSWNDRLMRWREGTFEGSIIVGGNGAGDKSNQLHSPMGLSFDVEGNLYLSDGGNHRIQKFDIALA